MQLGLTWPLQRLLKTSVPYGASLERSYCWDAHCITLYGRKSLLLVHCQTRYTCVRFDMSAKEWNRLSEIARNEIEEGLLDAGISEELVQQYLTDAGEIQFTRTHGRREVAFLNQAWEDVLSANCLIDETNYRQPALNFAVNNLLCRCAGEEKLDTALNRLKWCCGGKNE